jgi:hypothetical protein
MSIDKTLLAQIAGILDAVLEGRIDPNVALRQWPSESADRLVLDARHRLDHYTSDFDIHKTDPQYEKRQRKTLEEILDRIRGRIHEL